MSEVQAQAKNSRDSLVFGTVEISVVAGLIKPTVASSHAGVAVTWQQTAADSAHGEPQRGVCVKRQRFGASWIFTLHSMWEEKQKNKQRRVARLSASNSIRRLAC